MLFRSPSACHSGAALGAPEAGFGQRGGHAGVSQLTNYTMVLVHERPLMNHPRGRNISRVYTSLRWVLVVGTGIPWCLSCSERLAASAIGKSLAQYQYGLITGGWPGVDEIVTKSYISHMKSRNLSLSEYLIQVVSEERRVLFEEGHIVRVPQNTREWLDAQKFADAIIFVGGRGGTYVTWLGALYGGMPRFPLGGTPGDASTAFKQTYEYWELMPIPGIDKDQFQELGRSIKTELDAKGLSEYIIGKLLPQSLDAVDAIQRRNTDAAKSIFISYSHKDDGWVSRLRTLLRPAEKRGLISTWVDRDIEEGRDWEPQLQRQLDKCNFALILMSPNLLSSLYVNNIELPFFLQREKSEPDFHLFWVLLEACNWESISGLDKVQAIGGVKSSIGECSTDADKQVRLIQVVERLLQVLS